MKKILFTAPILFLLLIFNVEKVFACSCVALDPNVSLAQQVKDAYKNSSAVFSAKVLLIFENPDAGNKKVKLRLTKVWKGKLLKTFTITTGLGGGDCGYFFEVGKTYLIYAYRNEDKKLSTNICTRTSQTTGNKDVAVLNKMKR